MTRSNQNATGWYQPGLEGTIVAGSEISEPMQMEIREIKWVSRGQGRRGLYILSSVLKDANVAGRLA